ncbi:MAG: GerMN domain-containing protein [Clostridia bacterium]|nr:GerMN domain-containing protein [Clostridia bacterium]
MKRVICIILSFCILISCAACKGMEPESIDGDANIEEENEYDSAYRRTVLYYATEDGLMVPVMKKIPWEEGIGKAALSYLQSSYDNDYSASKLGVMTVIPKGTVIELKIDGTNAEVMLSQLPDMKEEEQKNMITAIVNTLTEFASIETVSIIANGKKILKETSKLVLNVEESEVAVSSSNAKRITLYFPNSQASLNVPVTRYVEGGTDFESAVQELIKGPENEKLLNCFPEGTKLNSASINENRAVVDLSGEFLKAEEVEGLISACYECLYLTASEYAVVYDVELKVDSENYDLNNLAVFAPMYANEF